MGTPKEITVTITITDPNIISLICMNNFNYKRSNEESIIDLLTEWDNHACGMDNSG